MLSGDKPANAEQRRSVKAAIYSPQQGLEEVRKFYDTLTAKLVREKSHSLSKVYQLDAVRE